MGEPIDLILDWDGTLTRKDTMFAMAGNARARDRRLGVVSSATESWTGFGQAYIDDYSTHKGQYRPLARERTDAEQESAWLRSLSHVEQKSVARVAQSGFFRGVKSADVFNAAFKVLASGQLAMRTGWEKAFLQTRRGSPVEAKIVSVNWSAAFIRVALNEAARNAEISPAERDMLRSGINSVNIVANEIDGLDAREGSTGDLTNGDDPGVRTSYDKLRQLPLSFDSLKVYVGDSATDFDSLSAVHLGVCIRDEPMQSSQASLAETFTRLGREVKHISNLSVADVQHGRSKDVVWARDFDEIMHFVHAL
nr:hypothetical protein B0A51_04554 [Rachicladosporium sp. CCFEE 5018]